MIRNKEPRPVDERFTPNPVYSLREMIETMVYWNRRDAISTGRHYKRKLHKRYKLH